MTAGKFIIPGLLMTGFDAGGFSNSSYASGLALAFATGLWAARGVTQRLKLPKPRLPAADTRGAALSHGRP